MADNGAVAGEGNNHHEWTEEMYCRVCLETTYGFSAPGVVRVLVLVSDGEWQAGQVQEAQP